MMKNITNAIKFLEKLHAADYSCYSKKDFTYLKRDIHASRANFTTEEYSTADHKAALLAVNTILTK